MKKSERFKIKEVKGYSVIDTRLGWTVQTFDSEEKAKNKIEEMVNHDL